jgi:ATP-dependent protease ClpP protease subunit
MYLDWMNTKEPVYIYINSTGTARDDGEPVSKIVQLVACSQVSLTLWLRICGV